MSENKLEVANTIRQQIGHKCLVMIGAKRFYGTLDSLGFCVGRNTSKVSHVQITLNADDLYDMKFSRFHGSNVTTISEVKGVYAEDLAGNIGRVTKMAVSL